MVMKIKSYYLLIFIYFILNGFSFGFSSEKTLTMCAEPWAPIDYQAHGQPKGIDVEVTKAIFEQLGIKPKIMIIPWQKCWEFVKTGKVDMALFVSKTSERQQYVNYPKTNVLNLNYVFFTNLLTYQNYQIKNCEDLKKYSFKIGLTEGNAYGKRLWDCLPYENLEKAKSEQSVVMSNTLEYSLRKLNWDKVQLVPMIQYIGMYNARKLHFENITYYPWSIFSKPYYAVFSKQSKFKSPEFANIDTLMSKYSQILAQFKKTEAFKKIINQYVKKHTRHVNTQVK